MCNVIDGRCELAGKYTNNLYHNKPDLYHQVHGELIELHSATKRLNDLDDPSYGYKIAAIRKKSAEKIIAICEIMTRDPEANQSL